MPAALATPSPAPTPALRVLMVHDSSDGPRTHGRMVISGRMSEVCAELDRLVALENSRWPN